MLSSNTNDQNIQISSSLQEQEYFNILLELNKNSLFQHYQMYKSSLINNFQTITPIDVQEIFKRWIVNFSQNQIPKILGIFAENVNQQNQNQNDVQQWANEFNQIFSNQIQSNNIFFNNMTFGAPSSNSTYPVKQQPIQPQQPVKAIQPVKNVQPIKAPTVLQEKPPLKDFEINQKKGLLWDRNGAPVMSAYLQKKYGSQEKVERILLTIDKQDYYIDEDDNQKKKKICGALKKYNEQVLYYNHQHNKQQKQVKFQDDSDKKRVQKQQKKEEQKHETESERKRKAMELKELNQILMNPEYEPLDQKKTTQENNETEDEDGEQMAIDDKTSQAICDRLAYQKWMKLSNEDRIKHKDVAEQFISNKITAQEFLAAINETVCKEQYHQQFEFHLQNNATEFQE